jgi:hypothetical protein
MTKSVNGIIKLEHPKNTTFEVSINTLSYFQIKEELF